MVYILEKERHLLPILIGHRKVELIIYNSDDGWYLWLPLSGYNRIGAFPLKIAGATPIAAEFDDDCRFDAELYIPQTGTLMAWMADQGFLAPVNPGTFLIQ